MCRIARTLYTPTVLFLEQSTKVSAAKSGPCKGEKEATSTRRSRLSPGFTVEMHEMLCSTSISLLLPLPPEPPPMTLFNTDIRLLDEGFAADLDCWWGVSAALLRI